MGKEHSSLIEVQGVSMTEELSGLIQLENYSKGKNVEEPLDKEKIPIPNLPEDVVWIQVQGGSKMRNLLDVAFREWEAGRDLLWTGSGSALGKAISCAELVKRKSNEVHQFNKVLYRKCEEFWEPKLEGLDRLVVAREVPMIHILLSHQPINTDLPGYQLPNESSKPTGLHKKKQRRQGKPHLDSQIENSGLRFSKGKPKKQMPNPTGTKNE